jgi:signal transduction histidine kinase
MAAERTSRWRRWSTVRVRTTVVATAVVGVALVAAAIGLMSVLRQSLFDNVQLSARVRADDVVGLLEAGTAPTELVLEDDEQETLVQVLDAEGEVLVAAPASIAREPMPAPAQGSRQRVDDLLARPGQPYLVVSEVVDDRPGARLTVVVARQLGPLERTLSSVLGLLVVGVPVLLLVVAITTWAVVGRALRPVEAIRTEVANISEAGLDRRVPEPSGEDEIARLARTMNGMLARLEASRDRQRRLVSDASHELRSPIATMRHQLEVALAHPEQADLPALGADLLSEDLRLQQIVDDLLLLARFDEGGPVRRAPVDVDDLVVAEARRLRSRALVEVDATAIAPARVEADVSQLARVVRNLTDNAERHAAARVALKLGVEGTEAVLTVDDDGAGLPPEQRDRVFDRFTRLDGARARDTGGAGLGLAIVAEVVRAHGGRVVVGEAPTGGARFEVRLPAVDTDREDGPG